MLSEVEKKLYDAALKGDVRTLMQLLEEDPYLVHGVSFPCSRNLLHAATMSGQTAIVVEVLKLNPRQAWILDSQKLSPLHIAAAEGHIEICQKLLSVAPEACFWRDSHDMNPLHIAAMKGHVEIVEYFLQESTLPALERLRGGGTVLHLCVKHGQLRTLKVLVRRLPDLSEVTDENGETILHLAVRSYQLETTEYLVDLEKIGKTLRNAMGKTPLQILGERQYVPTSNYSDFKRVLKRIPGPSWKRYLLPPITDMMMVVAVLIATVAFQTTVNPPGGVWQDTTSTHKAGHAVIAYRNPNTFKWLIDFNSIAFLSSIITILFIITGSPLINDFTLLITVSSALVSIFCIVGSYQASTMAISPEFEEGSLFSITSLIEDFCILLTVIVVNSVVNVYNWLSSWK